ncbi:hypothetical protein, partial [Bacillus cereus]
ITVNFVTNIEEQIEPVKLNVGQKIKIPKLSNKDKIFIGWYTNVLNQTSWDFKRNMGIRFRYFEPVTKIDRQKVNMECGSRIFLR